MIHLLFSLLIGAYSQKTLFLSQGEVNIQILDEFLDKESQDYTLVDPTNTFTIQQILTEIGGKQPYINLPQNIIKSKSYQNKKDFSSLGAYAVLDKNDGGYDLYYSDISLTATPELKNKVHILDQDPNANCHDFVFITKNQFAISCTLFDDINNVFNLEIITTEGDQVKLNYQIQTTKQYTYADSTIIDYDEKYLYLGVNSYNSIDQTYGTDSIIHVLDLVKINQIEITNLDITSTIVKEIRQQDFSLNNIIVSRDIVTFISYNQQFKSIFKIKLIQGKWQKYNIGYQLIYNQLKGYQIAYRFDFTSSTIEFAQIYVDQTQVQIFQESLSESHQIYINQFFQNPIIKLTSRYIIVLDENKIYTIDLKTQSQFVKYLDFKVDDPITIEVDYYRNLLTIFYKQFVKLYQVDQQLLIARPTKLTVTEQQLDITSDGQQYIIYYNIFEKTDYRIYLGKELVQPPKYLQFIYKQLNYNLDSNKISGPNIQLKSTLLKDISITCLDYQEYKFVVYEMQDKKSKYGNLVFSKQNPYLIQQYEDLSLQGFTCQFNSYNYNEFKFDCTFNSQIQFLNISQNVSIKIIPNQHYLYTSDFLLVNDKIEIYYNSIYFGTIDIDLKSVTDYLFSNKLIIIQTIKDIQIYQSAKLWTIINDQSLNQQGYATKFAPKGFFANSNFNGFLFIHNDDDILIGEISNQFSLIQQIKIPIQYSTIKISISKKILVYIFDTKFKLTIYSLIQQLGQFQLVLSNEYDYIFKPYTFTTNYRNGEVGILVQKDSKQYIACFRPFQQSRDFLGKLIPVPNDANFIQIGFYYDNSIIQYKTTTQTFIIKRLTNNYDIYLTVTNPLTKFSQKANIQYAFSNEYSNFTSLQPAIVEYGYFFFTGKSSIREDVRLKETTQIKLTYNSYSTGFYMYSNNKNSMKLVVPIKNVTTVQLQENFNCITNNGNLICIQIDQIVQYSNEGVLINALPLTVNSKIMVSRDDDQYVIIYHGSQTLLLLKTTKNSLLKIGQIDLEQSVKEIVYFQNYLILYSNILSISKIDIQEDSFTLTDQGIQVNDEIKKFIYQDAAKSIFYILYRQEVIKQIIIDLNQDTIPQNIIPIEHNILDTLNSYEIYYLDVKIFGFYATKQNIYINTNHGQVIKLKYSQNKFQVQNILVAGINYDDLNYVSETTNYTILQLNSPKVFRIFSNQKGENNVILSIQQVSSNLVPVVYEKETLTYINYFDQQNRVYLINTLSDDVYLDFYNISGFRVDYYSPAIMNDADQLQYSYKVQLYRSRQFQSSPWIIATIVMSLLIGGFIFYFVRQQKSQIPIESEPLNL